MAAGSVPLLPLIESAAGLSAVASIAACRGVARLVLGHIDFMADTGIQCGPDEAELAPLRFALAMATRMHELAPAVDGVTVAIQDDDRLRSRPDACWPGTLPDDRHRRVHGHAAPQPAVTLDRHAGRPGGRRSMRAHCAWLSP